MRRAALLAAVVLVAGCAENPITGREGVQLLDVATEQRMGDAALRQVLASERIVRDPAYVAAVERVGRRLVAAAGGNPADWRFYVVDDPDANAYALPGGNVIVNSGMFPVAAGDPGLAVVMAHEIGHVVARHSGERVSRDAMTQIGAGVLASVLGGGSQLAGLLGAGAQIGLALPAERRQELEADYMGLVLMQRAGYPPEAALDFWRRMAIATQGRARPPEFLSSHPTDATRLQQIAAMIPEVKARY